MNMYGNHFIKKIVSSTINNKIYYCLNTFNSLEKARVSIFSKPTVKQMSHDLKLRPYYLDNQATTILDPRVLDAMIPFFIDMYGNPHSRTHAYGWEADHFVEEARLKVANLIGAREKEIIFTSGATESNNLALKGVINYFDDKEKWHIITSQIEHKCLLSSCRYLEEKHGCEVTYLPVNNNGIISPEQVKSAIKPNTKLVSIMFVNNEIGVIQPIREIGKICKEHKIIFHTDAAQACGKLNINVEEDNIDLLSISAHKLYGPKGIGALYIRNAKPRIRLLPVISGGGQERGLRSGTVPTPLAVGFGEACKIGLEEMERDNKHIRFLEERLRNGILNKLSHVQMNGSSESRYKGNLNLSFEAVEGESLLMSLKTIALSSGSACTSASLEPSYVLRAIGVNEELAHTSLRFGIGRFTTVEEIDACINAIVKNVVNLRNMSPLWENILKNDSEGAKCIWT